MARGNYTVTFSYQDADLADVLHSTEDTFKNGDTTPESFTIHDGEGKLIADERGDYSEPDSENAQ
jgi:hypothetical protein